MQDFGLLLVFCRQKPLFVDDDLDLLSLLTAQTARTLSYSHLLVSERKARTQAEILAQIASRLSANIELEQTLSLLCEETLQATKRSFAVIFEYDSESEAFSLLQGDGHFGGIKDLRHPLPPGYLPQLISHPEPLLLQNVQPTPDWPEAEWVLKAGIHSLAHAPLIYKEKLIGHPVHWIDCLYRTAV